MANTNTTPALRSDAKLVMVRSLRGAGASCRAEWTEQFRSFSAARTWLRAQICESDRAIEHVVHLGGGVWTIDLRGDDQ